MKQWIYDEIALFEHRLSDEGKSGCTIRAYTSDVAQFLEYCGQGAVTEPLAPNWLNASKNSSGSATVTRRMSSLKAYFRLVHGTYPLVRYKAPPAPPGTAHPLPNLMDDVRAMLAVTKPRSDVRMAIGLMGFGGLRVSEAREMCWRNVDDLWLVVHGKGSKIRNVPIAPELRVIIDQHHCPDVTGGLMMDMTDRGVRAAVARIGRKAGISRPVSSHDLRMTFGTVVYDRTKDLRVVQELLGHASPVTTERYTGINESTKQLAVAAALP